MTLSKTQMQFAIAAFVASVSTAGAAPAHAQVVAQENTLRQSKSAVPVVVNVRPQAGGAAGGTGGAASGAGGAAAPAGQAGGTSGGLGTSGALGTSGGLGTAGALGTSGGQGPVPGPGLTSPQSPLLFPSPPIGAGQPSFGTDPGFSGTGVSGIGGLAQPGTSSSEGRLAPIPMENVRSPIAAADIRVDEIGTRVLPEDEAAKQAATVLPLPGGEERALSYLTYRWQSANICHWPLYFEEPMLERHGQRVCPPVLQPAVSGTKFVSNLLLYPYRATLWPALESRYTLGHFRPGSAAPLLKDTLPWSPRAAVVEGAAVTAVVVGLPW